MITSKPRTLRNWGSAGLTALALLLALTWTMWSSSVELSPSTYDLAIALYRACNQQDDEGLRQIQSELTELASQVGPEQEEIVKLQRIIDDARDGSWKSAMQQVHRVLNDQV